jgi:hypothetical protein
MASKSAPRATTTAAPEERDSFVYCKGCGTPLESRARLSKPRAVVDTMMCEDCREKHGHALMPAPGEPTFCYRCGGPEEVFVTPGISPATYHICPQCLPERYARYQAGDFDSDVAARQAEKEEKKEQAAQKA